MSPKPSKAETERLIAQEVVASSAKIEDLREREKDADNGDLRSIRRSIHTELTKLVPHVKNPEHLEIVRKHLGLTEEEAENYIGRIQDLAA